nr:MAG TPA: hypothetical protein [Caudoviricetes sp.]
MYQPYSGKKFVSGWPHLSAKTGEVLFGLMFVK